MHFSAFFSFLFFFVMSPLISGAPTATCLSATRAHTPAYIHDTHVKWSEARGYMYTYIHTYMHASCQSLTCEHARTHTQPKLPMK